MLPYLSYRSDVIVLLIFFRVEELSGLLFKELRQGKEVGPPLWLNPVYCMYIVTSLHHHSSILSIVIHTIRSLIHSFVDSFIHLLIHSFVDSFFHTFQSLVLSCSMASTLLPERSHWKGHNTALSQ